LGSIDDLVAVKLSALDNIEGISLLSLDNDVLSSSGLDLSHRINNDVQVFSIEVAEKDAPLDEMPDITLGLFTFRDNVGHELSLFVELAKHLGTDSLSAVLFINLLFLLSLKFSQEFSFFFLVLFIRVGLKSSVVLVVWIKMELLMSLKEYSLIKLGMLEGLFLTIS